MRETRSPEWTPFAAPGAARAVPRGAAAADEPPDLPVDDVLASVTSVVEPIARRQNVGWLVLSGATLSVHGDRRIVCQVVLNLALQAVAAAAGQRGGRVILSASDGDGDRVQFSVRDTGTRAADRRRGLDAARRVVERSGGRLRVERSAVGTWTLVELPCLPAA